MPGDNEISGLPWEQPGWLEEATGWIRGELARSGFEVAGPIEQPHVRPWSTVLRVPTTRGDIYFKATAPALGHEPGLTQALYSWRPDCMPEVLAVDLQRGWMLMVGSGVTLRSIIQPLGDFRRWREVLPLYAQVQIEIAERVGDILALGAFDRRLALLPGLYTDLLADRDSMFIGQPDGLAAEEYEQLRDMTSRFAQMCEQLAGFGIPETLHHDDFHDGNVFVKDDRYIFTDWGESCAAHPFFTMVVTLRSISYFFNLDEAGPEIEELKAAYLDPWKAFGSPSDLQEAMRLARRVGMVNRALTWHRVVSALKDEQRQEQADAVPGWLKEFLSTGTAAKNEGIPKPTTRSV